MGSLHVCFLSSVCLAAAPATTPTSDKMLGQCLLFHTAPFIIIFYLDDATLDGNEANVCGDFKMIKSEAAVVGLELNHHRIRTHQINLVLLFCTWHLAFVGSVPGLTNWFIR